MFAIIRTRWHTRPLSRRAKRRSSAAPGSLRKKYAGIVHPPIMVRLPNYSTISGDHRKPVLDVNRPAVDRECGFFERLAQGRMGVAGARDVLGRGAEFLGEGGFGDQGAGVGADA